MEIIAEPPKWENLSNVNVLEVDSTVSNAHGTILMLSMSLTLGTTYPQVNRQHKERSMLCTKTPKMANKNYVDVVQQPIAYLGHKSTCEEFQWIHERSSYEMLLAILKKRKKVDFFEYIKPQNKRPRLQSTSDSNNKEEVTNDAKTETSMDRPFIAFISVHQHHIKVRNKNTK